MRKSGTPGRRWRKRIRIGKLLGLGLLAAAALAVYTAREHQTALYPGLPGEPTVRVYLIDNGFHTDLAIPRAALSTRSDATKTAVDRMSL